MALLVQAGEIRLGVHMQMQVHRYRYRFSIGVGVGVGVGALLLRASLRSRRHRLPLVWVVPARGGIRGAREMPRMATSVLDTGGHCTHLFILRLLPES
jgi:hypothetical protein